MAVRTIDDLFRDFVNDGFPSSGPHHPYKPDIRDTLKKLLEGLSTFPDNRVIRLNNANTGTANNIIVSASVAIPATAYQVLYVLNITRTNTGPVTVSGAISRSLVTNTNQPVPVGYLTVGMAVLCVDTGSSLRMLSYGDMDVLIRAAQFEVEKAETARSASEVARNGSEAARDVSVANASLSLAYKTQAELAALAAGAPLFITQPDISSAPSPYLLQVDAGTQVWTHNGTARSMMGWLGKVTFPTVQNLLAFGGSLGPVTTELEAGGFRYEIVSAMSTSLNVTTSGNVSLKVLPDRQGTYSFAAWGPTVDEVTDDLPKFQNLLTTLPTSPVTIDPVNPQLPRIILPVGRMFFGGELNLKKAVHIQGGSSGLSGGQNGSVIRFPMNSNGIIINRSDTFSDGVVASTTAADGSILEGFTIESSFDNNVTNKHGFWLRARATITHCSARGFAGNGFHIRAQASGTGEIRGNANCFVLRDCSSVINLRHGFYMSGADGNAGYVAHCNAVNNGGWGFLDASFLGNSIVACHTSGNGIRTNITNGPIPRAFTRIGSQQYIANPNPALTENDFVNTEPGTDTNIWVPTANANIGSQWIDWIPDLPVGTFRSGGSYASSGGNGRATFIGCYIEGSQGRAVLSGRAVWIGGFYEYDVWGASIGAFESSLRLSGTTFRATPVSGAEGSARTSIQLSENVPFLASNSGVDIRLSYGVYAWSLGPGSPATSPIHITHANTSLTAGRSSPQPNVAVISKLFLGEANVGGPRQVLTRSSVPTSGEWARGDVIFNTSASANGKVGWVCITGGIAGSTAVFKPFGVIDA